jgi:hypothetical protein
MSVVDGQCPCGNREVENAKANRNVGRINDITAGRLVER